MIAEENVKELPKTVELPGKKWLYVVIEGSLPACYGYGQKGHIKKSCPLYISNDMEYVSNCIEGEKVNGNEMQEEEESTARVSNQEMTEEQ